MNKFLLKIFIKQAKKTYIFNVTMVRINKFIKPRNKIKNYIILKSYVQGTWSFAGFEPVLPLRFLR